MRPIPPEVRERAYDLIQQGRPHVEIARELGLSEATIRKWRREIQSEPAYAPVSPAVQGRLALAASVALPRAPAPDEPASVPVDLDDIEGTLSRFVQTATQNAEAAARDGNHTAAQRGMKDASNLALALIRHKRQVREQSENIVITREELQSTERTLRDRVGALLEKPLVCARCSREIAIEWGRTVKEDIPT